MDEKYKCILLVDDDALAIYLNKTLLDRLHISQSIQTVWNGSEALEYIKEGMEGKNGKSMPDIIFLDINMPVMNGIDFLENYEKIPITHKVKIFILTTSSSQKDINRINKFNIDGYIVKPLTKDKLNLHAII